MPSNISWGGSNLGPESCWLFFFYFRKIKDYSMSLSQDKSKFNYKVIHPGKLIGQVYHFIHFPSVLVWFFLPQSFLFSHSLCTILMEHWLSGNEFSAFPICLFFPNYSREWNGMFQHRDGLLWWWVSFQKCAVTWTTDSTISSDRQRAPWKPGLPREGWASKFHCCLFVFHGFPSSLPLTPCTWDRFQL